MAGDKPIRHVSRTSTAQQSKPEWESPSKLVETPWVQLPAHVQAHVRSWLHETKPGIKDLAYFWNRHLTDDGRMSILKRAGVD